MSLKALVRTSYTHSLSQHLPLQSQHALHLIHAAGKSHILTFGIITGQQTQKEVDVKGDPITYNADSATCNVMSQMITTVTVRQCELHLR